MKKIRDIIVSDNAPEQDVLWLKYLNEEKVYEPKVLGPLGWAGIKSKEVENEDEIYIINSKEKPANGYYDWDKINKAMEEGKALYLWNNTTDALIPVTSAHHDEIGYIKPLASPYSGPLYYNIDYRGSSTGYRIITDDNIGDDPNNPQYELYTKTYIDNNFASKAQKPYLLGSGIFVNNNTNEELQAALTEGFDGLKQAVINNRLVLAENPISDTQKGLYFPVNIDMVNENTIYIRFVTYGTNSSVDNIYIYYVTITNNNGTLTNTFKSIAFPQLVSGQTIKTLNGAPIVGSGNIENIFIIGTSILSTTATSEQLLAAIGGDWNAFINKITNGVIFVCRGTNSEVCVPMQVRYIDANTVDIIIDTGSDSTIGNNFQIRKVRLSNNGGTISNGIKSVRFYGHDPVNDAYGPNVYYMDFSTLTSSSSAEDISTAIGGSNNLLSAIKRGCKLYVKDMNPNVNTVPMIYECNYSLNQSESSVRLIYTEQTNSKLYTVKFTFNSSFTTVAKQVVSIDVTETP